MIKGYTNECLYKNLGNHNSKDINDYKERITMQKLKDGNYQALIRNFDKEDNDDDEREYLLIEKKSINDILKKSRVNQFFFGGLTVIGLYVVFKLIKKTK
tara:strand:- start:283 stop:582 length:300 start_codon:yes stop_codon:yes gene_type:complete